MSNVIRLFCVALVLAVACVGPHSMAAKAGELSRLQAEGVAHGAAHPGGAAATILDCHDELSSEPVVADRHGGGCEDCGLCVQKATRAGSQARELQAIQLEIAQAFLALAAVERYWVEASTDIEEPRHSSSLSPERSAHGGARKDILLTTSRIRI